MNFRCLFFLLFLWAAEKKTFIHLTKGGRRGALSSAVRASETRTDVGEGGAEEKPVHDEVMCVFVVGGCSSLDDEFLLPQALVGGLDHPPTHLTSSYFPHVHPHFSCIERESFEAVTNS